MLAKYPRVCNHVGWYHTVLTQSWYVLTSLMLGLRHVLFSQHLFFLPGPPNLVISRQNLQLPQSSLLQPEQVSHLCLLHAIGILESYSCMHYIMHCRPYSLPLVCPRFSCLEEVLSSFGIMSYWIELFISLLYYGVAVLCIYIFLLQFVFQNFLFFFIRMSVGKEKERNVIFRKQIL